MVVAASLPCRRYTAKEGSGDTESGRAARSGNGFPRGGGEDSRPPPGGPADRGRRSGGGLGELAVAFRGAEPITRPRLAENALVIEALTSCVRAGRRRSR